MPGVASDGIDTLDAGRSLSRLRVVALCGAPGSGKSTIHPYLVRAAAPMVVIDLDELLEDGQLLGVRIAGSAGEPVRPAYDRMWERIISMVTRAGHCVLVLCPIPSASALREPGGRIAQWILLDCPDDIRRSRLRARGWSSESIADAIEGASLDRQMVPDVVCWAGEAPGELSGRVLERVSRHT